MSRARRALAIAALLAVTAAASFEPVRAQDRRSAPADGHARRDHVLLGLHFLHSRLDCNARTRGLEDIVPTFLDYVDHMPEDLEAMSYADFWHWWYELERFKGDEAGLAALDTMVDACLERGLKVKIDLSWSTWWVEDLDWEEGPRLAFGPPDLDDWAHLVELVGRHYRGRVAVWHPQGEANDLKGYWRGRPIEHVQEVYRIAASGFKAADPAVRVSVAGASPSVPRESLDAWVSANVAALPGLFEDVPMNYFAQVADPYGGLAEYYTSVRAILDANGARDAEVGSGESSFQWAEASDRLAVPPPRSLEGVDPSKLPLCELKQAWQFHESMTDFFGLGGNKFVLWGTEYAPGGGWAWRWGLRKYQDWWGTWPESSKVPGTNIVHRFEPPGRAALELLPAWSSPPTDPYHPIWQVYRYWAQATPAGGEAIRLQARFTRREGAARDGLLLATHVAGQDRAVVLCPGKMPAGARLELDLGPCGWPDEDPVELEVVQQSINLATGELSARAGAISRILLSGGRAVIELPVLEGWTTLFLRPAPGAPLAATPLLCAPRRPARVGRPLEWQVCVENCGRASWLPGAIVLDGGSRMDPVELTRKVEPGETADLVVRAPAPTTAGRVAIPLRMRTRDLRGFGPQFLAVARVEDEPPLRKLVAHRGDGRILVQWFTSPAVEAAQKVELYRAEERGKPLKLLAELAGSSYVDRAVEPGRAYWYQVKFPPGSSVQGESPRDGVRVAARPRLFDADVLEHTIPRQLRRGGACTARVTLRNTGTRAWHLERSRYALSAVRLWGESDEKKLPAISLGSAGEVAAGETVVLELPLAALREGVFENHWVLTLDPPGKDRAYFGMPILAETTVQGDP